MTAILIEAQPQTAGISTIDGYAVRGHLADYGSYGCSVVHGGGVDTYDPYDELNEYEIPMAPERHKGRKGGRSAGRHSSPRSARWPRRR